MKSTTIIASLLASASVVSAHTLFARIFVDGEDQGDGTCIRMPQDSGSCTNPIDGLTSDDMACGKDGEVPAAYVCPTSGSSTLTFEFRIWPDAREPGALDKSHRGPCAVYVKPVSDMFSDAAAGPGWTKIWHRGYDEDADKWCTEELMDNNGLLSVELPSGLPEGYYLVRPELLALHAAASEDDPQYYVGCAQIYVTDGPAGSLDVPEENTVSIPGYIDGSESGNKFNIYEEPLDLPYEIPGPEPYSLSASGSSSSSSSSGISKSDINGTVPSDCLLKNANWCGRPLEPYSGSEDCWDAVDKCFAQGSECFDATAPTGVENCYTWNEDMCHAIQDECRDSGVSGPPDVQLKQYDVPVPGDIPEAVNKGAGSGSGSDEGGDDDGGDDDGSQSESDPTTTASPVSTASTSASASSSPSDLPGQVYLGEEDGEDASSDSESPAPEFEDDDEEEDSESESESDSDSDANPDTDSGSGLAASPDGTCGGDSGYTCAGSSFGECCSRKGQCGRRKRSCGCGCQAGFGKCRTDG